MNIMSGPGASDISSAARQKAATSCGSTSIGTPVSHTPPPPAAPQNGDRPILLRPGRGPPSDFPCAPARPGGAVWDGRADRVPSPGIRPARRETRSPPGGRPPRTRPS
ncbi:hypothetical protein GCM10009834_26030 [Streptomonospora arabica]